MSFSSRVKKRRTEVSKAVQQHEQGVLEQNNFRRLLKEDGIVRLNKLWTNDARNHRLREFVGMLQSNSELQEALRFIWDKWDVRANNWLNTSQKLTLKYFVVPEDEISFTPEEASGYDTTFDTWPTGLNPDEDRIIQNRQLLTDEQIKHFLEWKLPYLCYRGQYPPQYSAFGSGVCMEPDLSRHTWKGQRSSVYSRRKILIRLTFQKLDEQTINVFLDGSQYPHVCQSCNIGEVVDFLVNYAANL